MIRKLLDWHREFRARRLTIADFQWQAAEAALPFLGYLTPVERQALRELARRFIAEKQWSGAQGLLLSTEMQLTIALQACLPILKLGLDRYAGWVGIVVYPGDFVIRRQFMDDDGVMHEYDDEVLGEAWEGGPVLLSWFAAEHQPTHDHGEINIVIHEFAHKLDMAHGQADGLPYLPADMSRREWIDVMQSAFDTLNDRLDKGDETAIDPYAAETPAEFFAVTSEAFFTAADLLLAEYPEVYRLLARFYQQNPLQANPPARPENTFTQTYSAQDTCCEQRPAGKSKLRATMNHR